MENWRMQGHEPSEGMGKSVAACTHPLQKLEESRGRGLILVWGAAVTSNRESWKEEHENDNIVYLLNK